MPAAPVPGAPRGWIRCSRNQCQTAPAPISTGKDPPRPRSAPGRTRPASISSRNEKARVNGLRRPPWLFFCPRPAPISTGKNPAAHGDGLPELPGLGGVGLPDEQRAARPITCPGYSFQQNPAALLPAPLPDPTDNASRQPAGTPPPAKRRRGQILHLTG